MFVKLFAGKPNRDVSYTREKPETTSVEQRILENITYQHPVTLGINVNTVLILIRCCATPSKSASFDVSSSFFVS
jgi:hypothetical protein